ncbi:MAG: YtxH domain-containing protein [Elusimicrobia bacterium]|nr:YtxH domain-containing protein [Elusimicrobiota bacterium]
MADNDTGSGVLLFLTGAAVGAALGVFFAPRAGSETREQLADWLKERRERGGEILDKVKDESGAKKEALLAAAKAAKDAYREANAKHHDGAAA